MNGSILRREVAIIVTSLLMLLLVVFIIKVMDTAKSAYEDRIERACDKFEESKWGYLAPPMEKNDVWIREKESCEAGEQDRKP